MSTVLASVYITEALRMAGITMLPSTVPGTDRTSEGLIVLNRMLNGWNANADLIYTVDINLFPLTAGQKTYTIGTGGDFDMARPTFIKDANILFPTSPVVRRPVDLLSDDEWAAVAIQDISGAPPFQLYYDGGYDSNSLGNIYLRFQPPTGYSLELYTPHQLDDNMLSASTAIVVPDGYREAISLNLAVALADMYPHFAKMNPNVYTRAALAKRRIMTLNMENPRIGCDPALQGNTGANGSALVGRGWLDGGIR